MPKKNQVIITLNGGLVSNVKAPQGIEILVKDYDVEGTDESELTRDGDGKFYFESLWSDNN